MPELFGYQAGRRMADLDNASLKHAALEDRATELDIKAKETALKQNEAFLNAIKGNALDANVSSPEDMPDALTRLGEIALKTGNVEKGKELLTAGATIQNQASLAARREAKTRLEQMQTLSNLYSGVRNQADFDRANAQFQLITGVPTPYSKVPYSPEVVAQVQQATTSAKDKASVDLAEARKELVESQVEESTRRQKLIEAQTRNNNARTANLEKTGAKPVPPRYVSAVANKLQEEFEDIGDVPGQMNAVALPLAEQVYAKVQSDGLSLSQAVDSVVQDAIAAGDLGGWTPMTQYQPGAHRDRPLDIPTNKEGKVDTTKLKKNKYYQIPGTGQVVLYTREGKLLVIEPDAPDDADAGVDDSEDDEDEE